MWQEVTVDQDPLLLRTAELMRSGDLRTQFQSIPQRVATNRSEIGRGVSRLFYYLGSGFELMSMLTFQPKRSRYLVCYGVGGTVAPQAALDLLIEQTGELMQSLGLAEVYGFQPKHLGSPLLEQIYQLAAVDPRVQETLLSDLPDMRVYRVAITLAPRLPRRCP